MSKVYTIRGQGIGVITDKVYASHPTEADLREALVAELERHGLTPDGKARQRWVQVQEATLLGDFAGFVPKQPPKGAVPRLVGMLDEETVARILAEKAGSPSPQTAESAAPEMVLHGTGSVINPGEPGHVPADAGTQEGSK